MKALHLATTTHKILISTVVSALLAASSTNATVVIDENFSDVGVPTDWTLSAQSNLLYNATFGGSYKVSDSNPVSGYTTALVNTINSQRRSLALSYSFEEALQDFEATISFTWNNAIGTTQSGTSASITANPVLYFTFLDASNNVVARAGIYDNWTGSLGSYTAEIGGVSTNSGAGSLPASSSGINSISLLRIGDSIDINWENHLGTNVFSYSGTSVAEIASFQILTSMFRVDNMGGNNTAKFGEVAINQVTVSAIPEPTTLTFVLFTGILLLFANRKRRFHEK